jgi:hypothetical protein
MMQERLLWTSPRCRSSLKPDLRRLSLCVATIVCLRMCPVANADTEWEAFEPIVGDVQRGSSDTGPWEDVEAGDIMPACTWLKLGPALPSTVTICLRGTLPDCENCVPAEYDAYIPGVPFRIHLRERSSPAFVDIHPDDGVVLELEETGMCSGDDHCGIGTAFAEGYVFDEGGTPSDVTDFRVDYDPEQGTAKYWNYPDSFGQLATTPLLGPDVGETFYVSPGQMITYYDDGSHTYSSSIPTVSEWGLLIFALLASAVGTVMFGRRRYGSARA